jgi:co-chaperonin GroES (HSP10)
MTISPTGDRILVKVNQNSELSTGGVYVGQATTTFVNGKDKAVQETVGEVIAIGKGVYDKKGKRRPPDVAIGSIVCFSDTCGQFVDKEHLMIREQDVAFIMPEAATVELQYNNGESIACSME